MKFKKLIKKTASSNKVKNVFSKVRFFLRNLFKNKIFKIVAVFLSILIFLFLIKSLILAAWIDGTPIFRISIVRELEKQYGRAVLESLLNEKIIQKEIKKNNIEVTETDIDNSVAEIENSLKSKGASLDFLFKTYNMTMSDLRENLRNQIAIEKLLAGKFTISDQEIKERYETNKSLYGAKFETVKDAVRNEIFQTKLSEEYKKWLEEKRSKYKIRYFVKF